MSDLQPFIDEYVRDVVGGLIYDAVMQTVRSVIYGRGYPTSYSPNGRWDADAETALAHDWLERKLLRLHVLEHLLEANDSERGFRKGLELSFTDFLVGQRKLTALDNLFRRAHILLGSGPRFVLLVPSRNKGAQIWGLRTWGSSAKFNGSERELVAAAFRVERIPIIRYRDDARKNSPVLADADLGDFMAALLGEVGAGLTLADLKVAFAYRFDLRPKGEVSLENAEHADEEDEGTVPIEVIVAPGSVEDAAIRNDAVRQIIRELSTRQQRVVLEYARGDQSLASVAALIGCGKGTVDNDLRRAMQIIGQHSDTDEEAIDVHAKLVAVLAGMGWE